MPQMQLAVGPFVSYLGAGEPPMLAMTKECGIDDSDTGD
jgi:hypothetical protein